VAWGGEVHVLKKQEQFIPLPSSKAQKPNSEEQNAQAIPGNPILPCSEIPSATSFPLSPGSSCKP